MKFFENKEKSRFLKKVDDIKIFVDELEREEITEIKKLTFNSPEFSKNQLLVINSIEGNFLVIAGAGAGKTRSIVYRAKNMVDNCKIHPENILMITFTKKATSEMKERLEHLKIDLTKMTVTTFHSLCFNLLKNLGENFSSAEEDNDFDFEELINKVVEKLQTDSNFRKKLASKYKYIMVDEYQDSNGIQRDFLKILCDEGSNLMVVGDDCQSIYGFRGTKVENILLFKNDFQNARLIKLTSNYRSTEEIVRFINELSKNMKLKYNKVLISENGKNFSPEIIELSTSEQEGEYILVAIKKLLATGILPSEITVLYRNRFLIKHIENKLKANKIFVNLSTVHSAKGLEWKYVFVTSALHGVYGQTENREGKHHVKIKFDYEKEEEERRLFYVACSRAKEKLVITYPKMFHTSLADFYGMSKFLEEIPEEFYSFKKY
ncbi:MAG: ATP-dependent helicase [Fusobacteriaceae bacterium]